MANRFNWPDDAVRILSAFLHDNPQSDLAGEAHSLLADSYTKLGRYTDAARELQQQLLNSANLPDAARREIENDVAMAKTLSSVPPQSASIPANSTAPLTRDKIGLQNVAVEIGGVPGTAVLDTGANQSVLTVSRRRRDTA